MICIVCARPAEVSWPVRNNPHCRRCVAEARAFLAESSGRFPKFGGDSVPAEPVSVQPEQDERLALAVCA